MTDTYRPGSAVNIVQHFWRVDPLTLASTPADPTTVTFHVYQPDGTTLTYVFGVDLNVTHPSVGTYICRVAPPLQSGAYYYECIGTGALEAEDEGSWFVLPEGAVAPSPTFPEYGPCDSWIDGGDVARCGPDLGVGSETWRLNDVAADASTILYELTGRQFPGVCTRTVRPCRNDCGCWGSLSSGLGPWSWTSAFYGGGYDWGWRDERGDRCGCGALSVVRLAGWPVREIVSVTIDGTVLPPLDTNGNPNYRLDRFRDLVRMDDPGPPVQTRKWPGCQNLSLDPTQAGTFEVAYKWGMAPPTIAQMAASQLARELWAACTTGTCQLPQKVTKVVRQGITMDRVVAIADMLRAGSTGLQLVDTLIATTNPTKARRRPAVYSPDVQQFARTTGR